MCVASQARGKRAALAGGGRKGGNVGRALPVPQTIYIDAALAGLLGHSRDIEVRAVGGHGLREGAREGAPVATPLTWDELGPDVKGNHFNVTNLVRRLQHLPGDPWEGFFATRQSLKPLLARIRG